MGTVPREIAKPLHARNKLPVFEDTRRQCLESLRSCHCNFGARSRRRP